MKCWPLWNLVPSQKYLFSNSLRLCNMSIWGGEIKGTISTAIFAKCIPLLVQAKFEKNILLLTCLYSHLHFKWLSNSKLIKKNIKASRTWIILFMSTHVLCEHWMISNLETIVCVIYLQYGCSNELNIFDVGFLNGLDTCSITKHLTLVSSLNKTSNIVPNYVGRSSIWLNKGMW